MQEKFKKVEGAEYEGKKLEFPDTLDVIKINGRWAQFFHTGIFKGKRGNKEEYILVKWLDNRESEHILTKNLKGKPYAAKIVRDIRNQLNEVEFNTVHWGPEEKENPDIRDLVTVWGEFESK